MTCQPKQNDSTDASEALDALQIRMPSKGHLAITGSSEAARARFLSMISKAPTESGCLEWMGLKNDDGYGTFYIGGNVRAHRMAYFIHHGVLDKDMMVCHGCNNRACVNPEHLFLGDDQDNVTDLMVSGRHSEACKTHCKHGHPFTPDNVRIRSGGHRECITCKKHYNARRYTVEEYAK